MSDRNNPLGNFDEFLDDEIEVPAETEPVKIEKVFQKTTKYKPIKKKTEKKVEWKIITLKIKKEVHKNIKKAAIDQEMKDYELVNKILAKYFK